MFGVGEIVYSLISSIVYDGIKRPFKGLSDAVARRKSINRALGATSEEKSKTPPEINDIINIISHDHGKYTTAVSEFLHELRKSSIPDSLKKLSICGRDMELAFPAFNLLYKSHEPLPFSSKSLFDALVAAINSRLQQGVEEEVIYDAIKINSGEIINRIEDLARSLQKANSHTPLSASQFSEIRLRVAKGIEAANRQVTVETTQGAKKVAIKKIVISPRLSVISSNEMLMAHREAHSNREYSVNYLGFRRTFNKAIILGDPGGGKSTLTQSLCYDLARQISLESSTPKHDSFDSRDLILPLRVVLRALEKNQQRHPSYSIFDYLVDEVKIYCENDDNIAKKFLLQSLYLGEVVILFDGLDEILEVGARRAMAELIQKFVHSYATCPALVTSRIVGYKDAPLSDEFAMYTLAKLNKEEVRKFSGLLIRAISGLRKAEADEKANDFISQTESAASDLRENPLLLGLMVYVFNARGEVPNNRPEIYKECSMLMFEKWDQRRDIVFSFPQDFNLLDLFGHLALEIFGNAETEEGVTEEWLTEKLREFFLIWYDNNKSRSYEAAKVLVNFITGRAWVMCDVGPQLFKFTHRTFLEYFFARRLEEEAGGTVSLLERHLIGKALNAEWDVVSHLALQISTFRSGVRSTQAVDALVKYGTETNLSPKDEMNFLSFFARAIDYLIVPETKLRKVSTFIFSRCLHIGSRYNKNSVEIIHELLESTKSKQKFVEDTLRKLVDPRVDAPNSSERSFLLYLIGARVTGFRASSISGHYSPSDRVWQAFADTRIRIHADQYKRALVDANEARSYIYIYHDKIVEMYRKYRRDIFLQRASPLTPTEISALPFFLFVSSLRPNLLNRTHIYSPLKLGDQQRLELLDMLSEDFLSAWRSGDALDMLSETNYFAGSLLEELVFRARHGFQRPSHSRKHGFSSKEIFIILLFIWVTRKNAQNSGDPGRIRRRNHHESVSSIIMDDMKFFDSDEFGKAILEIAQQLRSDFPAPS